MMPEEEVRRLCMGIWDAIMNLSTVIWEVTAKEDLATAKKLDKIAELLQKLYDRECARRS